MKKTLFSNGKWFLTHPWIAGLNIFLGIFLILTGTLVFALNNTRQMLHQLSVGDVHAANQSALTALPIVTFYNAITFYSLPDLQVWQSILQLSQSVQSLLETSEQLATHYSNEKNADIKLLSPHITSLTNTTEMITSNLDDTFFIKDVVPIEIKYTLYKLPGYLKSASTALRAASEGKQIWVAILQNSDEIRATGGFPGSYALIHLNGGVLSDIVIEDIYDADGQFKGYINAPAGIREYTSSNKGLRLPDANWWPDFPSSAQTMLQFFALGEKQKISGLIAINSDLVQSLLDIAGPVALPDYTISLTAENMHEVLRSERGSFFPGSNQKKYILSQAMQQLQRQLASIPAEKKLAVIKHIKTSIDQKELQLYSPQPELQKIFSQYRIGGVIDETLFGTDPVLMSCGCEPLSLFLVESNVGINKVNPYINRTIDIQSQAGTLTITALFTNAATPLSVTELSSLLASSSASPIPRNGNGYLNYYRILIPPDYTIQTITIQGQPVEQWDEEIITTSQGEQLRQIGYLLAVPEKQSVESRIELTSKLTDPPAAIILYKQSGIPETEYRLSANGKEQLLYLSRDSVYSLQ